MSELRYDVVISGDLLDGFTLEQVKQNLVEMLQLTETKIARLFHEKHAPFVKGLLYEEASLYLEKLAKAGADSYLTRHQAAKKSSAITSDTASDGDIPKVTHPDNTITNQPSRTMGFVFSGNGAEYFRIWIVNIVLTILTLGIYSAWAKVRNNQYFYGNTQLDGASFVYRADPLQILKGRLIAFAFFAGYILMTSVFPATSLLFGVVFIFAFPWLVVKSLAFNAYYSEYRNVRFGFNGDYAGAITAFIGWPLLGLLSLGLLFPYAVYKQQCFMVRNYRYGDTSLVFEPGAAAYYLIFLGMIGIAIVSSIVIGLVSMGFSAEMRVVVSGILFVMMYLGLFVFYSVKTTNLRFNNAELGPHAFSAYLKAPSYLVLLLTNTLATVLTLGLFIPWAKVRVASYKAAHIDMLVNGDLNQFSADVSKRVGAFGEGMSDVFDMGISL